MDMYDPLQSEIILTPVQRAAVGCVAVESTYLEVHIEAMIWSLSGLDAKRGPLFTGNVQLSNRIELLRGLGDLLLDGEQHATFTGLIGDLKDCVAKRNTVIHGTWISQASDYLDLLVDGPEKHPPAKAIKDRRNKVPVTISATEIMDVAHRLSDLRRRLGDFYNRTWPNAWRDAPPIPDRA